MVNEYDLFLLHYNKVASDSMKKGELLFNCTTKFREMWHIMDMGRFLNPRLSWCYSFEDFIGRLKRAAAACFSGTPMYNVPGKLMENYILALTLELRKWE